MSHIDPIEFKRMLLLGAQVSSKHKEFAELAKLGDKNAETYSLFLWLDYLEAHPKATTTEAVKKLIELYGMAEFLTRSKEITRLSMIIGDRRRSKKYKQSGK